MFMTVSSTLQSLIRKVDAYGNAMLHFNILQDMTAQPCPAVHQKIAVAIFLIKVRIISLVDRKSVV